MVNNLKKYADHVSETSHILSTTSKQTEELSNQIALAIQEIAEGSTKLNMSKTSLTNVSLDLNKPSIHLTASKQSTQSAYEGDMAIVSATEHPDKISKTV